MKFKLATLPSPHGSIMSGSSSDASYSLSSDFNYRLRDSARKYKYRWSQPDGSQFSIDSAAIANAFPDFTGGTSDNLTIELAVVESISVNQAAVSQPLQDTQRDNINVINTDNHSSNYDNNTTDMLRQRVLNKTTSTANAQKENMAPDSSPYISNASRTSSGERKQLTELRAQVQSDTENSTMGTDRTTTTTFPPSKSRGSRFAQKKLDRANNMDKADAQPTPANISARFTSPAKTVTKTIAQPTQSSFIIQANGDMTSRDTEELGLPVIVEHGEVQNRKSSARRFKRVHGVRTPEEEEDLWLLTEKLKAENELLKSQYEFDKQTLQEENSKMEQHVSQWKKEMTSMFQQKMQEIAEVSRNLNLIKLETKAQEAEISTLRAEKAASSKNKEVEASDLSRLSRLQAELTQLRSDFLRSKTQETNTQQANNGMQSGSPNKVQKSTTHTFRSECRVESQGANSHMQFEIPNLKGQQIVTQPSRPESRGQAQRPNDSVQFDVSLPNLKSQPMFTQPPRLESRGEAERANDSMAFDVSLPNLIARGMFTQQSGPESRDEASRTNRSMQFDLPDPQASQHATRPESRASSHGMNMMQFELPAPKAQETPARTYRQQSRVEVRGTGTNVQTETLKIKTRHSSAQRFQAMSATEEPTLRPSVDPQQALATVMGQLNEELAEMKEELDQVTTQYMALDPSTKKRVRKETKAEMERLIHAIERKADQVYMLQDVYEGILPFDEDRE